MAKSRLDACSCWPTGLFTWSPAGRLASSLDHLLGDCPIPLGRLLGRPLGCPLGRPLGRHQRLTGCWLQAGWLGSCLLAVSRMAG